MIPAIADNDAAPESFSKPIQPHIDWYWTPEKETEVDNDIDDRYQNGTGLCGW